MVTQKKQKVQCELMTDGGGTVEINCGHGEKNQQTVQCEVPIEIGEAV
jgi:hypothetical protein